MTAAPPAPGVTIRRRSARVRGIWLLVVVALLVGLAAASLSIGSREVAWSDIAAALRGEVDSVAQAAIAKRIPRTVLALLAGAALGIAGAVMQGVTRNPLADPGILGVNMGAALAIVTGMAWFGLWTQTSMIWTAIGGAAATALLVYVMGSLGRGGATPLKLALAGAATSATLSSFISAVVLPRGDIAGSVRSWQIGGVGGATFDGISPAVPFIIVGTVICLASARALDLLALGDELAAGLGERVAVVRGLAALGAVILCGAITAVAGPIAFVGLVVPHVCRLMVGVNHVWLLPFSAAVGAALLTASDIVGRVVARPDELAVGIVTAVIGAPFFIAVVRRQKVRGL